MISALEAQRLADELETVIDGRECPSLFLFVAELRDYARAAVAKTTSTQFRTRARPTPRRPR